MSDTHAAGTSATWTRRPERGSLPLVRFMAWFSLTIGRRTSRLLVHAIAGYFFATSPAARRHIAAFLRRVHGREATLREVFGSIHTFATTIHDRLFFIAGRLDLFEVRVEGSAPLREGSAILLGAHLGSFEALRAAGAHRRVAMAMYEENARQLNGVLTAINPEALRDVVPLGHVGSMLAVDKRLEAGDVVGVLADRTLGEEQALRLPFLGDIASFPTGPMRMAAALRQRVFLMVGLYRGGNRYDVFLEPLADFSATPQSERCDLVRDTVVRYAGRLEHYARMAPDNWFNFHDFWAER